MCMNYTFLCLLWTRNDSIYPHAYLLFRGQSGIPTIASVPLNQPRGIWLKTPHESTLVIFCWIRHSLCFITTDMIDSYNFAISWLSLTVLTQMRVLNLFHWMAGAIQNKLERQQRARCYLLHINHDPGYDIRQRSWAVSWFLIQTLQWRHNGRDGVSNHQPHECLLNRLFRRRSK